MARMATARACPLSAREPLDFTWAHKQFAASVDVTPLFSLLENAIAKEPGLSYPE